MRITKCDICKKTIPPRTENLSLAYNNSTTFVSFEFCPICSKSILKILKAKKLIKIEDKKNGGRK